MSTTPLTFELALPPLTLECGASLDRVVVRGWWWGPAEEAAALAAAVQPVEPGAEAQQVVRRSVAAQAAVPPVRGRPLAGSVVPTVLCVHALTGDARVGGPGGWWEPVVGPGEPLDPRQLRLLCFNNLGSCYGTTGPADEGFPRLAEVPGSATSPDKGGFEVPEGELPAPITSWDQARVILAALDALGIEEVQLVAGGSVGGMIALALAALAPERFPRVAAIATLDRATPWIIGWNHIGRQVVAEALRHGNDPARALALARQVAHMTYRAGAGLMERHARRLAGGGAWDGRTPYAVQTYLEHQGTKLVKRFDPRAYISLIDAMDHHDLARPPPTPDAHEGWQVEGPWTGLARVTGRIDTVAIDTDELFFAREIHDLAVRHRLHGHEATWRLVHSPHGHDAFLMTWDPLRALLLECVRRIDPERFP